MNPELENADDFSTALERLEQLRRFSGTAGEFWRLYLQAMISLTGATAATAVRRRDEGGREWRRVEALPPAAVTDAERREFWVRLEQLCNHAATNGYTLDHWADPVAGRKDHAIAIRLEADRESEVWVIALIMAGSTTASAQEALRRARLASYVPGHFQLRRIALHLKSGEGGAVSVLDLVALLYRCSRFMEAAMAVCNEVAARNRCDRVTIGWEERGMVRVRAVSHADNVARKMEAVQALEAAMEECFDQEEPIIWPLPAGETLIARDHAKFAASQGVPHLCSIPLRVNDRPVGILCCERAAEPFEEEEARDLCLCGDLAAPRLADLHRRDRWFGARWLASARESAAKLLGPEHTVAKIVAVVIAMALGVLFLGRTTHRIEAPFTLRADTLSYLSVPFDGFIGEVAVEAGAKIMPGDTLLTLDTRDLLLEEAAALADSDRYQREEEKYRADNALAEMRIAQAQLAQSRVRLDLVRHRLKQARITAPYEGFVVEGDLKERIGAPVRQGDVLFRVSRLESAYIEARVDERDIQDVAVGARGEIAFASQPKLTFPVKIVLIEPVAATEEKGNVFIVRCVVGGAKPEPWWRPGMTGLTKLEAGRRTFFAIIFQRTIDQLRLWLWW